MGRAVFGAIEFERDLVAVAPEPILARFERLDQVVLRRMEVSRRMAIRRAVAAPDVPAGGAPPKMDPPPADLEAIRAPIIGRFVVGWIDCVEMVACHGDVR